MSGRVLGLLALGLLATGCAVPTGSSSYDGPRTRCLSQPGRGESYSSTSDRPLSYSPDRPLFFLFCVESP